MEGIVESHLTQGPAAPGNNNPGRERQDRQRYDNKQYQYNAAHHTLCVTGLFTLKPIRQYGLVLRRRLNCRFADIEGRDAGGWD